jgi:hypothetical protein
VGWYDGSPFVQEEPGGPLGQVVIGYVVCVACCSFCSIAGIVALVVFGYGCLRDEEGCGAADHPVGGVVMVGVAALPIFLVPPTPHRSLHLRANFGFAADLSTGRWRAGGALLHAPQAGRRWHLPQGLGHGWRPPRAPHQEDGDPLSATPSCPPPPTLDGRACRAGAGRSHARRNQPHARSVFLSFSQLRPTLRQPCRGIQVFAWAFAWQPPESLWPQTRTSSTGTHAEAHTIPLTRGSFKSCTTLDLPQGYAASFTSTANGKFRDFLQPLYI